MFKVGITGGIGSGKTTACRIFEILGIPVYYADIRAKQLMNSDPELKALLEDYFGKDIYESGVLNRRQLANIVFHDKTSLEQLNSWVHPAVARDFLQWCEQQHTPYVLEEAAILFESGTAQNFWKVILVTAPNDVRVKRVCERDHVEPSSVYDRIANQWPDEKKLALADYVIHNDESSLMVPQIMDIHQQLLSAIKPKSK